VFVVFSLTPWQLLPVGFAQWTWIFGAVFLQFVFVQMDEGVWIGLSGEVFVPPTDNPDFYSLFLLLDAVVTVCHLFLPVACED